MSRKITLLVLLLILFSCKQAEKPTDIFWKDLIYGATARAVEINNMNFNVGDPESTFDSQFRFLAKDVGAAVENVNIYIGYKDQSILGTTITGPEVLFRALTPDDFYEGPDLYPWYNLRFTFAEALEALQMELNQVVCKDQFLLRFEISIDTGLTLSASSATPCMMGAGSFVDSPFVYEINVVEPIDEDAFVGRYFYESIVDGFNGGSIGPEGIITLTRGHSVNTRAINGGPIYFTIACDGTIMGRHFFQPGLNFCRTLGNASLLGPDNENATIIPEDDSIIDLWMVEGYLGFDGGNDFGTLSTEVRFSKQ